MMILDRSFLIPAKSLFSEQVFKQVAASLKLTFPDITASWLNGFKKKALSLCYSDQDLLDVLHRFTGKESFPCFIPAYRHFIKPVAKIFVFSHDDIDILCIEGGKSRSNFGMIHEDEKGPLFALSADIKKYNIPTLSRASINSQQRFS